MAFVRAGQGFVGAGGQRFMSSVLAKASMPGGYTRTIPRTTNVIRRAAAPVAGGVNAAALEALKKAKAQYALGGGFGTGVEAAIERGEKQAVSAGAQELVGAGLAGTTMIGGLGKKYQEEVAMPARLSIEEQRAQALAGIEMAEAGMGFEAGQAGLQRSFQARESSMQRELQRYIADMQARMQRESVAFQPTTPTGGYARQFPSLYNVPTRSSPGLPTDIDFDFGDTAGPGRNIPGRNIPGRVIPGQYTPSAMSEYLKTYTPQTGDVSMMPEY